MPTYEYRCTNGHDFEDFVLKMSAAKMELPCPTCGERGARRVSAGGGLLFKGSGFYITDYGKDGKKSAAAPASANGGKTDGAKSEGGKSEGGKSEGGASGGGKSEVGKAEGGKSDGGKAEGGKADAGKSGAPKSDSKPSSTSGGAPAKSGE